MQDYYCSGLENLSAGCEAAVVRLAACKDKPHVEDLVAIHTHGLAGAVQNSLLWYRLGLGLEGHFIPFFSVFTIS